MGGIQGEGLRDVFSQWGNAVVQAQSYLFLKILAEGAVTSETGSLFFYFACWLMLPSVVNAVGFWLT